MKQKELFQIEKDGLVIPFDPHVAPKEAKIRLSRQCAMILARLRRGPVLTGELRKMAAKYTGRISNIRQARHRVVAKCLDAKTGVWEYTLEEQGLTNG